MEYHPKKFPEGIGVRINDHTVTGTPNTIPWYNTYSVVITL